MRTMTRTSASRSADWLTYFTRNRANRMTIPWERGVSVSVFLQKPLIASLQRFQVGEQGDGQYLRQHADRTGDPVYAAAIQLFVQEEQEHSRLLARLLLALNAELLESHWSDTAFMLVRRLSGLHLELLILLIAEIIAKRYYPALAQGVSDPVAHAVFEQIIRDEQGHVAFHCDVLGHDFAPLPAPIKALLRFGWHCAFSIVCLLVMLDHRGILRAVGVRPSVFWRDCNTLFDEAADEIFPQDAYSPARF